MTALLRYGDLTLALDAEPEVTSQIAAELAPFFELQILGSATIQMRLEISSAPPEDLPSDRDGEAIVVDGSLYAHLRSTGRRWDLASGRYVIVIDATGSQVWFDQRRKHVALCNPDTAKQVLDGVRLVKSLVTVTLESQGAVQLHCSGVCVDAGDDQPPSAVLLLGDSRQGKTTVLLELLRTFRVRQLSCDTVVLWRSTGGVRVRGWPSPFSASHGTLADHQELHDFIPETRRSASYAALWSDGVKSVLDSKVVTSRLGRSIEPQCDEIATCIVLEYAPERATGLSVIETEAEFAEAVASYYLGSHDPIYPNFHQFVATTDAQIDRNVREMAELVHRQCGALSMVWAPSVESLLKRVWPLGRAHETLGDLLAQPESLAIPAARRPDHVA